MRAVILGALMAGSLVMPGFAAAPSMEALVRASNVPYEGTMVINGHTVVKVVHGPGDRRRQEIVSPLRMKGDVIVDNGKTLWHFSPRTQKVDLSPTRQWGDRTAERLRLLTQNYKMKLLGREKVAGRPVHVVELTSVHGNRGTHRLWLDHDTVVPLRVERRSSAGKLLERTEFREISFPESVSPEHFRLELPDKVEVTTTVRLLASARSLSELSEPVPFPARLPAYLPKGYELLDLHLFEAKGVKSLHWRLSDGLTTLSLFMTEKGHFPELPHAREITVGKKKARLVEHPGRQTLCWTDDRLGYAMVGEIPEDELMKVVEATISTN